MEIPEEEIWFSFSRSGGPGGQNVNKVSSKVMLHWNLGASRAFSDLQKNVIRNSPLVRSHLDEAGNFTLISQSSRSQAANRKIAIDKLKQLLHLALIPKKQRKKTRTPKGQIEKRIQSKKLRSMRLKSRKVDRAE